MFQCIAYRDDGPLCRAPTPMLYEIEIDEGFSLDDLMQEPGRLELKALGRVKYGDMPRTAEDRE